MRITSNLHTYTYSDNFYIENFKNILDILNFECHMVVLIELIDQFYGAIDLNSEDSLVVVCTMQTF